MRNSAGGIRSGFLEFVSKANVNRDVVVYDYRGAGLSEPPLDSDRLTEARCGVQHVRGVFQAVYVHRLNLDE